MNQQKRIDTQIFNLCKRIEWLREVERRINLELKTEQTRKIELISKINNKEEG